MSRYPDVNGRRFSRGLTRFFREDHPDSNWLKWTYCKNFYSLSIIGFGDSSDALTKEVFDGTVAYLDTNVLVSALDSTSENHAAVIQVITKLRDAGGTISVLRATVRELRDLAKKWGERYGAFLRQIPDELLPRVRSVITRAELRHRKDPDSPSPKDVLKELEGAEILVRDRLKATIVDDDLFGATGASREISESAQRLLDHYNQTPPFFRHKTFRAAVHDAIALNFVSERRGEGENCVFLTLDRSLPTAPQFQSEEGQSRIRNAITVDSLLPWLGMVSQDDEEISKAYSSLLADQLVTAKQTLSPNEFEMLAEIGENCQHMPAEDVEGVVKLLRNEAQGMDVRKAKDREKLHNVVRSYFSSPDRRFVSEIAELRGELNNTNKLLERVSGDRNKTRSALQKASRLNEETKKRLDQVSKDKEEESRRRDAENREFRNKIVRAQMRLCVTVVVALFALETFGCLWVVDRYGAGENFFQKIIESWEFVLIPVSLSVATLRIMSRGILWFEIKKRFRRFGGE